MAAGDADNAYSGLPDGSHCVQHQPTKTLNSLFRRAKEMFRKKTPVQRKAVCSGQVFPDTKLSFFSAFTGDTPPLC